MKMRFITSLVLVLFLLASAGGVWAQDGGPEGPGWSTGPSSGEGPAETQPAETQPAPPVETGPAEPPQPGSPSYPEEGAQPEDLAGQGEPMPEEMQSLGGGGLNTGGFVFVLRGSGTGSFIDRYSADAGNGSLTYLGSTNTGQNADQFWNAHMLSYDAVNYRLYALHNTSSTITAYSVDRISGWLTPLPFSPISLGSSSWEAISLHPSGSPLIVSNYNGSSVTSYRIQASATHGQPTVTANFVGSYSTGTAKPYSLAFSADGQYFYVGGNNLTFMAGFTVNPTSGGLAALPGSPFDMGTNSPVAYATDPSGRLFLSGYPSAMSKTATTSAGVPTVVHTLPSNGLAGAVDGLVHPGGNFYLVADRSGNKVGVYRISGSGAGSTLAAVAGSPFATGGTYTQALATNTSGSVVYALNSTSRTITCFAFNASTGALSGAATTTTPGADGTLQGIAYAKYNPPPATGGFIYSLRRDSSGDNHIDTYLASSLAELALVKSTPTGGKGSTYLYPRDLVYDPLNARLFALNDGSTIRSVNVFSVDPVSGSLTPLYTIDLADFSGIGLVIHPSGSPLIVMGNTAVASYQVTATGATQAAGSPFSTGGSYSFDGVFSQNGDYFYTGGDNGTIILGFSVSSASGVLAALTGSPYNTGITWPASYVTDTTGRIFLAGVNASLVATTSAGIPTMGNALNPNGVNNGVFGVLHPSGFHIVANRATAGSVGVFRIEGSGAGTTLAATAGSPFATNGTLTSFLALNETGRILYAGNRTDGTITPMIMDPFAGTLSAIDKTAPASAGARINGMAYVAKVTPGGFYYTLSNNNGAANMIYGYRLDQSTGALSLLNGFPVATGGNGDATWFYQRLAYDPENQRLYALNASSKSISAYTVNPFTGALTAMSFSPFTFPSDSFPKFIAVHPKGSPVLVGDSQQVFSFNVTGTTISPAAGSPFAVPNGNTLNTLTFTLDGAYAYFGGSQLNGARVNQATGAIILLEGSPFATDGELIVGPIDATGRVFTARWNANTLRVSTIDAAGALTTVHNTAFPGTNQCVLSALHPNGFLVVACQSNILGSFKINGSGAGTTLSPTGFGSIPTAGTVTNVPVFDRRYQYVVAMNAQSYNLTSYAFDASTGGLYPVSAMPQGAVGRGYLNGLVYTPVLTPVYLPVVRK